MKNKYYIILLSVAVLCVVYFLRQPKKIDQAEVQKTMIETAQKLGLKVTKTDRKIASEDLVKELLPKSDDQYVNRTDYFNNKILKDESAKIIYQRSLSLLGDSEQGRLTAEYIAEGVVREDTPQFNQYMNDLIADLNNDNKNIINLVISKESELQKNKFQYQMVLNMAYAMEMPSHIKARVLGGALFKPFSFDSKGVVSVESTNVTNALILLKNSNIPKDQVYKYIKIGLAVNSKNKEALIQFQSRANSFFPDMVDKITQ